MILKLRVSAVISHMNLKFENTSCVGCGGLVSCIAYSQTGSLEKAIAPPARMQKNPGVFNPETAKTMVF